MIGMEGGKGDCETIVESAQESGENALHFAVAAGQQAAVEELVRLGINKTAYNKVCSCGIRSESCSWLTPCSATCRRACGLWTLVSRFAIQKLFGFLEASFPVRTNTGRCGGIHPFTLCLLRSS
jgi:hypothetical protein